MDDLMNKVDQKNAEAAQKMAELHVCPLTALFLSVHTHTRGTQEISSKLISEMSSDLVNWRDRVSGIESSVKKMQGYGC